MTMQTSGPISLGDARTEIGYQSGSLSLGNVEVRNLARHLSLTDTMHLSELYGETYLDAELASKIVAQNRWTVFRHNAHPNGLTEDRPVRNSALNRNSTTASMRHTMTFPQEWTRSSTAIVALGGELRDNKLTSLRVNNIDLNYTQLGTAADTVVYSASVPFNYQYIGDISATWERIDANRVSAGLIGILPGSWITTETSYTDNTVNSLICGPYTVNIGILEGGYDSGRHLIDPGSLPAGVYHLDIDQYWYNNIIVWVIINTTGVPQTVSFNGNNPWAMAVVGCIYQGYGTSTSVDFYKLTGSGRFTIPEGFNRMQAVLVGGGGGGGWGVGGGGGGGGFTHGFFWGVGGGGGWCRCCGNGGWHPSRCWRILQLLSGCWWGSRDTKHSRWLWEPRILWLWWL